MHALLEFLDGRIDGIPRVLSFDERGREVLTFLPGRVVDENSEMLTPAQIDSLVRWTRRFHDVVAGFTHAGPWRYVGFPEPTLIGHNDIAPYNMCFDGDDLVGVFDWDLAGPTTPVMELAFIAWNCVPLWRDIGDDATVERLTGIAEAYGDVPAREIARRRSGTDPDNARLDRPRRSRRRHRAATADDTGRAGPLAASTRRAGPAPAPARHLTQLSRACPQLTPRRPAGRGRAGRAVADRSR